MSVSRTSDRARHCCGRRTLLCGTQLLLLGAKILLFDTRTALFVTFPQDMAMEVYKIYGTTDITASHKPTQKLN